MSRRIGILRLSHRHFRDQRITTHVALTARAFGCTTFAYTGDEDKSMEKSILDIADRFGGTFSVTYLDGYSKYIKNWSGKVVHLSMFGESHLETISDLQPFSDEDLLLIVGGPKVPPPVYELADFNTAIGHQPHSEIAAIAVFLADLVGSNTLYQEFPGAKVSIPPGSKANRSKMRTE